MEANRNRWSAGYPVLALAAYQPATVPPISPALRARVCQNKLQAKEAKKERLVWTSVVVSSGFSEMVR